MKLTRTNNEEHEQTRKTMVTQKDTTDIRLYCQLSPPPPPHSEAASDSQQPHSTLGSTRSALHRSDHARSNVSMDTSHLERENRTKKDISCKRSRKHKERKKSKIESKSFNGDILKKKKPIE